jgi:sugar phosphate isomerase/epimerase
MNRRDFCTRSAAFLGAMHFSRSMASLVEAACPITIDRLESSTSSFAGMTFLEALEAARHIGFAGIEILAFSDGKHSIGYLPGAVVADLSPDARDQALKSVRQFKHVTTHLPFYSVYLASKDEATRDAAMAKLHAAIDDSVFWGASVGTLHAAAEPGQTYHENLSGLVKSLRELGAHAELVHLRLGVEIGWPNTTEQYLGLIQEVDHPAVGGTIDTGHVKSYTKNLGISATEHTQPIPAGPYNDVLSKLVDGLGPKLFHFHVDDVNASIWRDHRELGTGIVDWKRLIRHLSKQKYDGLFALELEEPAVLNAAEQSRNFFKRILLESDQEC